MYEDWVRLSLLSASQISLLRVPSYFGLGYTPSLAFTSGMAACVNLLLTNRVGQNYAKIYILRDTYSAALIEECGLSGLWVAVRCIWILARADRPRFARRGYLLAKKRCVSNREFVWIYNLMHFLPVLNATVFHMRECREVVYLADWIGPCDKVGT